MRSPATPRGTAAHTWLSTFGKVRAGLGLAGPFAEDAQWRALCALPSTLRVDSSRKSRLLAWRPCCMQAALSGAACCGCLPRSRHAKRGTDPLLCTASPEWRPLAFLQVPSPRQSGARRRCSDGAALHVSKQGQERLRHAAAALRCMLLCHALYLCTVACRQHHRPLASNMWPAMRSCAPSAAETFGQPCGRAGGQVTRPSTALFLRRSSGSNSSSKETRLHSHSRQDSQGFRQTSWKWAQEETKHQQSRSRWRRHNGGRCGGGSWCPWRMGCLGWVGGSTWQHLWE